MIVQRIECDVCANVKNKTNYWLKSTLSHEGVLSFFPWHDTPITNTKEVYDLCGVGCATQILSRHFQKLVKA